MIKAKDMKKNIDNEWISKNWEALKKSTSGRKAFMTGKYSANKATVSQFERELSENGFMVSFGFNSHGVKMIIAEW